MEDKLIGREALKQNFVAKEYLTTYVSVGCGGPPTCGTIYAPALEKLHKTFSRGDIRGDTLIDIGSGPTIYQHVSACEYFQEIITSDFLEQNQEEIKKWLKKDPEAYDWSLILKYVCELEGNREKWMEKEEKLRRTIKRVLPCDATLPNPFDPVVLPPADCLLSTFALEVACKDHSIYRSVVKNLGALVKPGGHLIFAATLGVSYWMVGPSKFDCMALTPEVVEGAVKDAGFEILSCESLGFTFPPGICDAYDALFLVARKPK
uniref:Indolethylamine N-methyltransferase-like n=1 Tax=Anolis carolinensis TaxID=28377 RepID=L7MZI3_ANOCA|nr:PREDICTED: indolethylamine N-methyltransferase [Anolis carolinensis]|eukprot:XP_003228833.1 PREDICTED: indolethylamine N-methyltransferase [Anolis carolinensis]